ncbi:hypothetical protein E2320_021926 [Naja naja]|nr:hypothetical protein E2320_021926 [Naja naja]
MQLAVPSFQRNWNTILAHSPTSHLHFRNLRTHVSAVSVAILRRNRNFSKKAGKAVPILFSFLPGHCNFQNHVYT